MTNPTDTNQASELFELCKEVYERFPEWKDTLTLVDDGGYTRQPSFKNMLFDDETPLYTSDYLLERLPPRLDIVWYLTVGEAAGAWGAWYMHGISKQTHDKLQFIADTPLKALLKLTIALSEAGELNE